MLFISSIKFKNIVSKFIFYIFKIKKLIKNFFYFLKKTCLQDYYQINLN